MTPRLAAVVATVALSSLTLVAGAHAAFPGANGAIAFDNGDSGIFKAYKVNPDGSGLTRLFDPNEDLDIVSEFPAWSADGLTIAFDRSVYPDPGADIWVMNGDGSGKHPAITSEDRLSEPSWSPDGASLAFTRDHGFSAGNHEIWTARADGSHAVRLTTNAAEDIHPAWSPGGGRIAFASNRDGNYDIYVMNADGSAQTRLTSAASEDRGPDWSPDGAQLSFVSDNDLVRMRADGTHQVTLAENAESERGGGTAWSPDGTRIAFIFSCHGESGCPFFGDVATVRTDGTGLIRVTSLGFTRNPDWQPLDVVAPSITISSPVENATYRRKQVVLADYACSSPTPGGSAVTSCRGDVPDGAPIDTSRTGVKTFTVRARDAAGNERTLSRTYRVIRRGGRNHSR